MVEPLTARSGSSARRGEFGDYLRSLRGDASQREVALRVGRTMEWYRKIETGSRTYLTTGEVTLLSKALSADVREVFTEARKAGY
jgi:transcriptional regulator with XRE-family HTH domain